MDRVRGLCGKEWPNWLSWARPWTWLFFRSCSSGTIASLAKPQLIENWDLWSNASSVDSIRVVWITNHDEMVQGDKGGGQWSGLSPKRRDGRPDLEQQQTNRDRPTDRLNVELTQTTRNSWPAQNSKNVAQDLSQKRAGVVLLSHSLSHFCHCPLHSSILGSLLFPDGMIGFALLWVGLVVAIHYVLLLSLWMNELGRADSPEKYPCARYSAWLQTRVDDNSRGLIPLAPAFAQFAAPSAFTQPAKTNELLVQKSEKGHAPESMQVDARYFCKWWRWKTEEKKCSRCSHWARRA